MSQCNQNNISVVGLGYVGCVTSSCLAYLRHKVIGVDVNNEKVNLINNACPPIEEPLLAEYLKFGIQHEYLQATSNLKEAINNTSITFVCVCTPARDDGSCDLSHVTKLIKDIGEALSKKSQEHVIIIRSTIPPGTMEKLIIPSLEKYSNKKNNRDFYTCFHPEFLREGSAIHDFFNPPKYIIGEAENSHAGDKILDLLLLHKNDNNVIRTNLTTAELVKYTDNVWHALKVSFANEIGTIADGYNINAHELMEIFCKDTKLNISNYYLKPGLSYGGSCLPKDLQSMQYIVNQQNLDLPVIKAISNSNNLNIQRTYEFVKKHSHGKIGWYGITFKENTNDLRNSVHLEILAKILAETDFEINVFDDNLKNESLIDEQKALLKNKISNYDKVSVNDFIKLIDSVDTIVIGHPIEEYKNALLQYPKPLTILDLANIGIDNTKTHHNYHGLFW